MGPHAEAFFPSYDHYIPACIQKGTKRSLSYPPIESHQLSPLPGAIKGQPAILNACRFVSYSDNDYDKKKSHISRVRMKESANFLFMKKQIDLK